MTQAASSGTELSGGWTACEKPTLKGTATRGVPQAQGIASGRSRAATSRERRDRCAAGRGATRGVSRGYFFRLAGCHAGGKEPPCAAVVQRGDHRKQNGRGGDSTTRLAPILGDGVKRHMGRAEATGFEPAVSALTGLHVRPLHHASKSGVHSSPENRGVSRC